MGTVTVSTVITLALDSLFGTDLATVRTLTVSTVITLTPDILFAADLASVSAVAPHALLFGHSLSWRSGQQKTHSESHNNSSSHAVQQCQLGDSFSAGRHVLGHIVHSHSRGNSCVLKFLQVNVLL